MSIPPAIINCVSCFVNKTSAVILKLKKKRRTVILKIQWDPLPKNSIGYFTVFEIQKGRYYKNPKRP